MERLWVLSGDERVIDEEHLSPAIGKRRAPLRVEPAAPAPAAIPTSPPTSPIAEASASVHVSLPDAVEALERSMIQKELEKARGNKTRAAEALGISRRNLIRKVQAYGLEDGVRSSSEGDAEEVEG
jgi:DNA-binding NtrC family response regulator